MSTDGLLAKGITNLFKTLHKYLDGAIIIKVICLCHHIPAFSGMILRIPLFT